MSDDDEGNIMTNRERFVMVEGGAKPSGRITREQALQQAAQLNPTSVEELIRSARVIEDYLAGSVAPVSPPQEPPVAR